MDIRPADPLAMNLRAEATKAAQRHWQTQHGSDWIEEEKRLRDGIVARAGIQFYPKLPMLLKETNRVQLEGELEMAAIRFQTLPGVFATASLYMPKGPGPFPAILLTHGHWEGGRNSTLFQEVARNIARNGYVCLAIDAWGAGERSSIHGIAEYHGNNLGASLLNIGKTLLGIQVTENVRAIDLLCTLPSVDRNNLGVTGASGGGNQAMWVAAMDERIAAAVPVVSVGTFQSYIMNSNCVCELLPGGLTFTEEAGVLALVAPRALRIISAKREANPSFTPAQMLRSYQQARPVFEKLGRAGHIDYMLVDGVHGYDLNMQEAAISWFDLHLKRQAGSRPSVSAVQTLEPNALSTYTAGKREKQVLTTSEYCIIEGRRQKEALLNSFINAEEKKHMLRQLLQLREDKVDRVSPLTASAGMERMELTTSTGDKLIAAFARPADPKMGYAVLVHGQGCNHLPQELCSAIRRRGQGLVMADLWGTGARSSEEATEIDGSLSPHHTLSRSLLWLGRTMMGRWASELLLLTQWVRSVAPQVEIHLTGYREAGLAALYAAPFGNTLASITAVDTPVSYLFDTVEGVDYYNMSVHVPGILKWGDIGLLGALSNCPITFREPRTLSGNRLDADTGLLSHKDYFKTVQRIANRYVDIRFDSLSPTN